MNEIQPPLSFEGERRRGQILELALAEARGRRRRRVVAKAAVAALLLALLVPPLLRLNHGAHHDTIVRRVEPSVPTPPEPSIAITRIETDPHIIERLALRPQESHVVVITDRELLRELAAAHRPAALAYVDGKPTLMFR